MREEKITLLPLAGAQLTKLRFCGNGKDSEVTIETVGNRKAVIPLSFARLHLSLSGPISMACESLDDLDIAWKIAPTPDQFILIEDAAIVDFPGTSVDLAEALQDYECMGTFSWAVKLRLKLTSTERRADAPGAPSHE